MNEDMDVVRTGTAETSFTDTALSHGGCTSTKSRPRTLPVRVSGSSYANADTGLVSPGNRSGSIGSLCDDHRLTPA